MAESAINASLREGADWRGLNHGAAEPMPDDIAKGTYRGECHCGRVSFELRARLGYALDCNCSLCRRRGALWHAATDADLTILSGESDLLLYQFNTMAAKHYFCRHCGIHPFARPRLDPSRWVVNLRCIDGVDLAAIPVQAFDGANWETAARAFLEHSRRSLGA